MAEGVKVQLAPRVDDAIGRGLSACEIEAELETLFAEVEREYRAIFRNEFVRLVLNGARNFAKARAHTLPGLPAAGEPVH